MQDAIAGAPDHNSAEHALWLGRPLLGQWVFDVVCLLDWLSLQPGLDHRRLAVVGIGQAGVVALCASALEETQVAVAGSVSGPVTFVTDESYPAGTRMGLLAPGILHVGDITHLAALSAPRRLIIAAGQSSEGKSMSDKDLQKAFSFTRSIYRLFKAEGQLLVTTSDQAKELARRF